MRISKLLTPLWGFFSFFVKKNTAPTVPKQILIFDFHLIGDIVMLTPMLKALRLGYPNSRLVLVAGSWAKEVLYGTELVDKIIPFSAPWVKYGQGLKGLFSCYNLVKKLRSNDWDLGIEVRGDIRQILLLWLAGARRRVGYDFTGGAPLLTDVVFDDGCLASITTHHKRICEHLGVWNVRENYIPFLKLSPIEYEMANKLVPYIGFHFGASLPLRRLPQSEIIKLLSKFHNSESKLIVFLSPDEKEFESVLNQMPESMQSKIELWSGTLREFIVFISRASRFYCMDSGPAHIASALGVPTVVFFGPAEIEYVRPIGISVKIVNNPNVNCRPCNQVNCTNKVNQYCMIGLVDKVSVREDDSKLFRFTTSDASVYNSDT